jgi:hypothetical protein
MHFRISDKATLERYPETAYVAHQPSKEACLVKMTKFSPGSGTEDSMSSKPLECICSAFNPNYMSIWLSYMHIDTLSLDDAHIRPKNGAIAGIVNGADCSNVDIGEVLT